MVPRASARRWTLAATACVVAVGAPAGWCAEGVPASALYAPIDLEVVDAGATVAVALKAGEHLPVVVTHDPGVALAVGDTFDAAFVQTRSTFLERIVADFGVATLEATTVGEPAFREFRADFQAANTLFPVSPALAQTWARGFDGETVRERISGLLRAFERDQLIGEVRPASSVFVVAPGAAEGARTWGEVAPRARAVEPSAVLPLPAAGDLLRRMNDPLDRAAGGYLSGLLRANITEDRYLTGLLLRDRMGAAVQHRRIAHGTKLADAGQPVDAWAGLALEHLARLGIKPLDTPPESHAAAAAELAGSAATAVPGRVPAWIGWTASVGVLGMCIAAARIVSRRRRTTALQVTPGETVSGHEGEGMIPHLARELKDRLVRALFTQRSVLLANEQAASRRVQEMEERLARLQPAIAERIRGYEQRIEALEKEIAERDAETRDLLRAKLVLARKELDAEIARNRIGWN